MTLADIWVSIAKNHQLYIVDMLLQTCRGQTQSAMQSFGHARFTSHFRVQWAKLKEGVVHWSDLNELALSQKRSVQVLCK